MILSYLKRALVVIASRIKWSSPQTSSGRNCLLRRKGHATPQPRGQQPFESSGHSRTPRGGGSGEFKILRIFFQNFWIFLAYLGYRRWKKFEIMGIPVAFSKLRIVSSISCPHRPAEIVVQLVTVFYDNIFPSPFCTNRNVAGRRPR